jgi:hypothetical protein
MELERRKLKALRSLKQILFRLEKEREVSPEISTVTTDFELAQGGR